MRTVIQLYTSNRLEDADLIIRFFFNPNLQKLHGNVDSRDRDFKFFKLVERLVYQLG